ncbi:MULTISPECIES: hypothetical protein [Paracoccus]|uniref:hypothetical protein n=1 Tax=Paracoccus TaxID=265 RepID=UPI001FB815D9|nr:MULTISPECIES: hypothetical protein [Paracoccus]MCJ1898836.1 hypothetical protein [Paracoccus versutus]MDF3903242.1 hypothetical protein [Paracoccus sp. AS002]WGR61014.1 hypothetical protein E3U26_10000 [Paracoccus ferrooxidans]
MLLSACDTSGLDPATADQVNQSEMTAAVGLPGAAFGGDAYRDARLQVATASPNDAAQRRSAAEAAPAATGSPIQSATATLDTPAAASAGASRPGTGKCEQRPQGRAASSRLRDYSDRLLAPGRARRQLGPCLGQDGMMRREQGIAVLETCLAEARAAGDAECVAGIPAALQDTRRLAAEARQTANQSCVYAPDGWMASCPA